MNTIRNPYIGPRTFKEDERDRFYGREREANELLARVLSEQEIVFYAQSGAGKSSLVNTCLIPDLKKNGFEVLLGRVGGDAPAGLEVDNIFVFNLLRSLSTIDVNVNVLAKQTLDEFLVPTADVPPDSDRRGSKRRALIIDQFEEIFSSHHEAWERRKEFFEQLARALEADPRLRVILVMREDYIASLDPYANILPSQFRMRYFMQRLEYPAALKAVKEPVKGDDFSRPYETGAAEKLVDDLRTIKVIKPDGTPDVGVGQFVEPLYLQVICYELWNNLPADGTAITMKNVQDVGDVSTSLGNYYARRVATVAQAENVNEGKIRKWFTDELISPAGIRNMVLQEPGEKSANLENRVIRALSDLIRAEQRGATFYELTHDRLVEPIIASNRRWFEEHLSPLQKEAALWDVQGRTDSWLLSDQALVEVEEWAEVHRAELTDIEQEFLEVCRTRQAERKEKQERDAERQELENAKRLMDEQARSARIARWFSVVAGVLMVIAIIASAIAYVQANDAKTAQADALDQANAALSGKLSAYALNILNSQPDLAILLSLEADRINSDLSSRNALLTMQQENAYVRNFLRPNTIPDEVQFSPDGKIMAFRDKNGITLWDTNTLKALHNDSFKGHFSGVTALALSKDGKIMASGATEGTIVIWDVINWKTIKEAFKAHKGSISSLAINQDGTILASASWEENSINLWDITDATKPQQIGEPLLEHLGNINSLAFSPDGKTLASGSGDSSIILWNVETQKPISEPLTGHREEVFSVAFTPDGDTLASGSYDDTIILWNVSDLSNPQQIGDPLEGHEIDIEVIAISPDGKTLASGDDYGNLILWDVSDRENPKAIGDPLNGNTSWIISLAFSPDSKTLAAGSLSREVILWDVKKRTQIGKTLLDHKASVWGVAFSPDGETLVTASEDSFINSWDISKPENPDTLQGHPGVPTGIQFSADGNLLASSGYEGTIFFDVTSQEQMGYGDFIKIDSANGILAYQITNNKGEITVYLKDIASGIVTDIPVPGTNPLLAPNGKILIYQTADTENNQSQFHFWDVPANKALSASIPGENPTFSPDSQLLIYQTTDEESGQGSINIWDVAKSKNIGEAIPGFFLTLSPDSKILVYQTDDPETGEAFINQWDIAEARSHSESILGTTMGISQNGEILAFQSWDTSTETSFIQVLNVSTGDVLENFGNKGEFLALSADGHLLFYQTYDNTGSHINVINTQTGKEVVNPIEGELPYNEVFQAGEVLAYEFTKYDNNTGSSDFGMVLIDTKNDTIIGNVIDRGSYRDQTSDGKILVYETIEKNGNHNINLLDTTTKLPIGQPIRGSYLGISPDGKTLAFSNESGLITLWDLSKIWPLGEPVMGAPEKVSHVAISPDGKTLAWVDNEGIVLQDVASGTIKGKPIYNHFRNEFPGNNTSFSPDGRMLAIGNDSTATTIVWDSNTQAQIGDEFPGNYPSFSPDGRMLAIGNDGTSTTTVWDVSTQAQIGDEFRGNYPRFSPAGGMLAIMDWNTGTTTVWDLSTQTQIGNEFSGSNTSFSADGRMLAIGNDGTATTTVWDLSSQTKIGDEFPGNYPSFSADGRMLAIGNDGTSTTTVWDVSTQAQIGDEFPGSYPRFSPAGGMLAIMDWNTGTTTVWDLSTQAQIGGEFSGNDASFSPDGKMFAIGDWNTATTIVWDSNTQAQIGDEFPGNYPSFSPDGRMLAIGNDGTSTTTVWDVSTQAQIGDEFRGNYPFFSPAGGMLAIMDWNNSTTTLWNLSNDKLLIQPISERAIPATSMIFSPDNEILASLASDGIVLRNLDANTIVRLEAEEYSRQLTNKMSFYANGTRFVVIAEDGTLLTWDASGGKTIIPDEKNQPPKLRLGTSPVFSPDGTYLAYSYSDTYLIIWDVNDGKMYAAPDDFPDIQNSVGAITFSEDGKWMAYSDGPKIVLWNMQNRNSEEDTLLTEAATISRLNLIMSGKDIKYIISVDESGTTQIWDWESRTKIGNPMPGNMQVVGLNALDRIVYYIDPNGRLIQWQWGSDLTDLFCSLVRRNFTQEEWTTYVQGKEYPKDNLTCPDYPAGQTVVNSDAPNLQTTSTLDQATTLSELPATTATQPPTLAPAVEATGISTINSSSTIVPIEDIESLIETANILVYEDTVAEGLWIGKMMEESGYDKNTTFVHDRLGDFKTALTSTDTQWDLIIYAAESHSTLSGEFWDQIKNQLDKGTAVIVETWAINRQSEGKIKPILEGCGVELQSNLELAVPLKWYDPDHPIFNNPNQVADLSRMNRHWETDAGDLMQLTSGSNATILAGTSKEMVDSGVITSCYNGQMILQTFSNHDYPQAQISELWQNYVYNLLYNRFAK